jgi:L-2-hydroxyglutarate oxidase LhgO
VPVRRCGKIVVARTPEDLGPLAVLAERAQHNGVPVEVVDERQARELEPLARTVEKALWSPTTSSASPTQVVEALADRIRRRGGQILLGTEVVHVRPGVVVTPRDTFHVGHLVNAAGLYADRVARPFGVGADYAMLPFKGVYWYGESTLQRHVYPVPDARNPFLGVHLTVTVNGHTKIGPTAIPALWREDYGGLRGLKTREMAEVGRTLPKFLRSPHHDVTGLIRTEVPNYSRRHLVGKAQDLVPSVRAQQFRTRGRPGIRAQLFHLPTRRLEMDFVVEPGERSTHILNAVSPAWTSSLAFAEHVVDDMVIAG